MKKRFEQKKNNTSLSLRLGLLTLFIFLGFLTYSIWPSLQTKQLTQRQDAQISIAVDWTDIVLFSQREQQSVVSLLNQLKQIPVHSIALPVIEPIEVEQQVRNQGFHLFWRARSDINSEVQGVINRFKEGDGLISFGNKALGYPSRLHDVSQLMSQKKGILPLIEFAPQKGLTFLAQKNPTQLVKGHCLQAKEQLFDKRSLWKARLLRAVKERWVRLLYLQLSPALSFNENIQFQKQVVESLQSSGTQVGFPKPFRGWSLSPFQKALPLSLRLKGILFIICIAPLVGLILIQRIPRVSSVLVYLIFCGWSLWVGLIIHGLGSDPATVMGVSSFRGVKIGLLVPLLLGVGILIQRAELRNFLKSSIKWNQILLGGGLGLLVLGFYLSRSGNFPLVPVTDVERSFRDGLEAFFGARPRFKEFLIGHPLLLLGLYIQSKKNQKSHFFKDGRFFILLGLLGQISILNTFLHFQKPWELGVLRTVHGVWLGFLAAVPLCYLYSKMVRDE